MSDDEDDEEAFAPGGDASGPDADSPFDELDADVDDVDLDELFDEMFTEADTGEIDSESVWEQLEGVEPGDDSGETEPGGGPEDALGDAEAGQTSGEEHIVAVREFCAQCEYAAEPPGVHCTYEGSEIVEFVDKDSVRVRNCPIVAQRRQVGDLE